MASLRRGAAAERFVATADLTEYNLARFKLMRFESDPKSSTHHMRLLHSLLDAVKAQADTQPARASRCGLVLPCTSRRRGALKFKVT